MPVGPPPGTTAAKPGRRFPRRLIAPAVLIAVIAVVWSLGLTDRLSWSGLAHEQTSLRVWIAAHPWLSPCLFVAGYIVSVALSLPQAGLLTIAGGLLFGVVHGAAMAVTGATIGAVLLFLIARSALAGPMARRGGATLSRLREELHRHGFSYLLALRLLPVVPFWLLNLAAPLAGMRLGPFAAATFLGVIPVTSVYALIGADAGDLLARGERPDLHLLFTWPILGPLLVLAALALTPVLWRKVQARRG